MCIRRYAPPQVQPARSADLLVWRRLSAVCACHNQPPFFLFLVSEFICVHNRTKFSAMWREIGETIMFSIPFSRLSSANSQPPKSLIGLTTTFPSGGFESFRLIEEMN